MSVMFKDFNKDVKDLLTKNYAEKGAWKLETKFKGADNKIFVNPGATGKGLNVDVQYNQKPFKVCTTLTDKGGVKPKVTWSQGPHKVEVSVDLDKKYELVYEGAFNGNVAVHTKVANAVVDDFVSFSTGPFSVGGGAAYDINKGALKGYQAGLRFADKGYLVDVTTDSLKTYTTGVLAPLSVANKKFTLAAQVTCGHDKPLLWSAGVEGPCFVCPSAKFRAKVNQDLLVSFAWIEKFADLWKVAISADFKLNGEKPVIGWTFTRE